MALVLVKELLNESESLTWNNEVSQSTSSTDYAARGSTCSKTWNVHLAKFQTFRELMFTVFGWRRKIIITSGSSREFVFSKLCSSTLLLRNFFWQLKSSVVSWGRTMKAFLNKRDLTYAGKFRMESCLGRSVHPEFWKKSRRKLHVKDTNVSWFVSFWVSFAGGVCGN